MNKKIKIVFGFTLVAAFSVIVYLLAQKIKQKNEAQLNVKKLPAFEFTTLEQTSFSNKDLKKGSLVFIFFSTECDYCHYEARELKKNIDKFSDTQVCMVCSDEKSKVEDFVKVYDLDKYPQIKVVLDPQHKSFNYFSVSSVPVVYIYNKEAALVKEYKGEVKMEAILASIKS